MSSNQSPSHWAAPQSIDDRLLKEAAFTEDISVRMRVPKRITASGEITGDDYISQPPPSWTNHKEQFDMNVPDRILLLGQDQHIGTRAPPREIVLENSVLGSALVGGHEEAGNVRVQTPPRVLTLQQHVFPTADDPPPSPPRSAPLPLIQATPNQHFNDTRLTFRESTPPDSLTAGEEVVHLRRQVARINRRVTALEMESLQRQQRERLAAAIGLAYLVFKVIAWLNRS